MFNKKFFIRHWRIILVELLLLIIMLGALFSLFSDHNKVFVAAVVPHESYKKLEHNGKDAIEALHVYADRVNKSGGINGRKLEIVSFYDEGNPKIARKKAQEIVAANKFVAVLGHFSAETTEAAIDIYDKAKIPLIAPISNLKNKSKWVFQTSPTPESYGVYMANYIKQILLKDSIIIINSQEQDNQDLIKSFVKAFKRLGGTVVINELEQKSYANDTNRMLLLATQIQQTIPLVVALKHNDIKLPVMSIDTALGNELKAYGNELEAYELKNKKHSGYYSDGIYVPAVMLLDTIPLSELALVKKDYEKNHNNENISYTGLNAALSASFIVKNLTKFKISTNDLDVTHQQLRDKIEKDSWFNTEQKGKKNKLVVGIFKEQHLVKAPINPFTVNSATKLTHEQRSNLIKIDDDELYPRNVVHTGISMNKISEIDMDNLTYHMDFFLWFRHGDKVTNAHDIEFLNTIKPTRLYDVLAKTETQQDNVTATLVKSNSFNGENYLCYHIKGRFKTTKSKNYALGQQNLYVKFRHYSSNWYVLQYASDFMNTNKGIFNLEGKGSSFGVIEDESLTLNYNYSYVNSSYKPMLGHPEGKAQSQNFSQFIAEYRVKHILWSFRGIVPWINKKLSGKEDLIDMALMAILLSISCGIFIFTLYKRRRQMFGKTAAYWWLLQFFITFFILLFGELVVSQTLFNLKGSIGHFHSSMMIYFNYLIGILWWIIPAYYLTSALEQFLWQPVKKRTGAEIPHVLRLFVTIFIYVLAAFGIMAYVLEVTITGLAATSGIIAVIFAFASKIDLSNIIAGLGVSFSKVFRLGDWVKIDAVEGQVVEMTPRSTKVLTFNSSIINIPNTTVAAAIIENYTHPDPAFRLIIHLEIVPIYRFERVEKVLLDAVSSTENILDEPPPKVIFKGQGDSCQIYEVAFFINDYAKRYALWQATWRRIWRHLEQADITLATPQREILTAKVTTTDISAPLAMINNCGAFAELSDESKSQLAQKLQTRSYSAEDIILRQGEANDSLFIITEGVVSFEEKSASVDTVKIQRLGVAELFGQMSLINCQVIDATVKAKTDTELLEIKKEDFVSVVTDKE
ncbi:mechanosensitive ion channel [Candidatus Halobeggiatoa sp. HSG11]|nr:mechanosensitive ion channel [Candidatus Halobeggiatoa sp. HSG11]